MPAKRIPGTWETTLTPELIARQRTVSAPRLAPDGRALAFAVEFDGRTDLFVDGGEGWPRQVTASHALVGGSYLILVALVAAGIAPWYVLLALLTLPSAINLIRITALYDAPARLNKVLRGTAKLHERFGWLMIVGVVAAIAARIA